MASAGFNVDWSVDEEYSAASRRGDGLWHSKCGRPSGWTEDVLGTGIGQEVLSCLDQLTELSDIICVDDYLR